jgi:hypothetical protein
MVLSLLEINERVTMDIDMVSINSKTENIFFQRWMDIKIISFCLQNQKSVKSIALMPFSFLDSSLHAPPKMISAIAWHF